jgi:hypothetical protein
MNKKAIVIFLIYFIQFLATSCFSPCDCDPIKTFERTYNNLELKAWDTSGFQNEEVINSAYKNAFGLTISVQFELNQISFSKPMLDMRSFGFISAYAFSDCDCAIDEYINLDPILSIKINVTDLENQEIIDVTDNFTTYNYNGEQVTISELFEIREDWHDGFQVDMLEYDNIPDSALFTVIILLESGTELIKQTQEITFE